MSVTLPATDEAAVATTADATAESGRAYVTLYGFHGEPVAYLPASVEVLNALIASLQHARDTIAPRDDALTDALADAWTDALVQADIAERPIF